MEQPRRPPARGPTQAGWAAAALLARERQAPELCPGVKRQPYVCETGHCCGESGCCIYYYELWWFWLLWTVLILFSCCCAYRHRRTKLRLQQQQRQREINLIAYHGACSYHPSMVDLRVSASFKLPAYEEVAQCPTTPPPPYSAILGGSSTLTLTGSSENGTSYSCDSSCLMSPSSTSLSATEDSSPSEGEAEGASGCSCSSTGGSWELAAKPGSTFGTSHKHTLFSSNLELFESDPWCLSESDEGPEAGGETNHLRHRRLTGDSGIEVGRGQDDEEAGSEAATHLLGKRAPCSQPEEPTEGGVGELATSPTLPI